LSLMAPPALRHRFTASGRFGRARAAQGCQRDTTMAHRKVHFDVAHPADKADSTTLTRIESVVIFGSIGSGLLACALGAFIFDIGRAFAAW
jgi:hypothetical protein